MLKISSKETAPGALQPQMIQPLTDVPKHRDVA